ncbi:MAG: type II toxin-antitoxin system VapC family toxin [Acidobacteriaceae bacterium]
MNYLLDTHILLWTLVDPDRVPGRMRRLIENAGNRVWFSAASIWEIAIKHSLGRDDFPVEPATIWKAARETGLEELAVTAEQAAGVDALPWLHRDPFDRLLVAQARAAGMKLLSLDREVNGYFSRGGRGKKDAGRVEK